MTEQPVTPTQEEGLFGAARETGIGLLIGLFFGLAALMRPSVRGHEAMALYGLTAAGALTFLLRFLLASLSDRGTGWYYLVWAFSCLLACLVVIAFLFVRSGFDGELLGGAFILAPAVGVWFGHVMRRGRRV